ncbi:OmpA family protein [uncultured Shimia sp.]|uniref:OmpA family protein n=1 Tax=uncultured Shimia sp. TaxID=573152 RepID=UPI002634A98C|nr:OmpA family protein [uncultured Shimia sp.]
MKHVIASVSLIALSACNWDSYPEAGGTLDRGNFGYATINNQQIQSGEKDYVIGLANRFATEVNSTVNFAFDSAQLDEQARAILRQQAQWIRQFPEVRFRVYGHTDSVGSDQYNYNLGKRRANAAVRFLTSQGIDRSRLEAVVSRGKTQPLIVSQGRERKNRRTVTEVTGFVKRHPSIMDGKYAEIVYREYVNSATAPTGLTGIAGSDFETSE